MRSYRINTDRMVNQLVPHYLGGRKLILFLQAILQPLNSLNVKWKEWADEKRIEAAMTSQVIMMEYFLNHKFRKYFLDTSEHIVISDGAINGVPIYWKMLIKIYANFLCITKAKPKLADTQPLHCVGKMKRCQQVM